MAGMYKVGVWFTRKTFILVRNFRFAFPPQSASRGTLPVMLNTNNKIKYET